MKALRQIGEEFWYDFGVDIGSNDSRGTRILYKVVEHVEAEEHGATYWLERVEPIKVEKYESTG